MKVRFLVSVTVLFVLAVDASRAFAVDYYVALAYSRSLARVRGVTHELSLDAAKTKALRECGERDCYIAISAKNECVSSAFSRPTWNGHLYVQWYGFGKGADEATADRQALRICEYNAHDYCTTHTSLCATPPLVEEERAMTPEEAYRFAPEGSPVAWGILKVVNTYAADLLQREVGLTAPVAARLRAFHGYFGTLAAFLRETGIGARQFDRLLGFALTKGYIHPSDLQGDRG